MESNAGAQAANSASPEKATGGATLLSSFKKDKAAVTEVDEERVAAKNTSVQQGFERFVKDLPLRTERVDALITKMDKEFQRYYKRPAGEALDEQFKERVEFCFEVYQNCIGELTFDFSEVGIEFLGQTFERLFLAVRHKLFFTLKSFLLYMTKHGLQDDFDVDAFQKEKRLQKESAPTHQEGITDDEFIKLLRSDENEEVKREKMKKFFDPMVLEYQESLTDIDEVLKNKLAMLSLQPTKIGEHLQKTLHEIQSKLSVEVAGFEEFSQHEKEVLFYLKYFQGGYMVKQLTDEISQMVSRQTNDKFKKVLRQVIQGNKKAREEYYKEGETQTDETSAQLAKLISELKDKIKELESELEDKSSLVLEYEPFKARCLGAEKAKQTADQALAAIQETNRVLEREGFNLKAQVQKFATEVYDLQEERKKLQALNGTHTDESVSNSNIAAIEQDTERDMASQEDLENAMAISAIPVHTSESADAEVQCELLQNSGSIANLKDNENEHDEEFENRVSESQKGDARGAKVEKGGNKSSNKSKNTKLEQGEEKNSLEKAIRAKISDSEKKNSSDSNKLPKKHMQQSSSIEEQNEAEEHESSREEDKEQTKRQRKRTQQSDLEIEENEEKSDGGDVENQQHDEYKNNSEEENQDDRINFEKQDEIANKKERSRKLSHSGRVKFSHFSKALVNDPNFWKELNIQKQSDREKIVIDVLDSAAAKEEDRDDDDDEEEDIAQKKVLGRIMDGLVEVQEIDAENRQEILRRVIVVIENTEGENNQRARRKRKNRTERIGDAQAISPDESTQHEFETPETKRKLMDARVEELLGLEEEDRNEEQKFNEIHKRNLFENAILRSLEHGRGTRALSHFSSQPRLTAAQKQSLLGYQYPFEDRTKRIIVELPAVRYSSMLDSAVVESGVTADALLAAAATTNNTNVTGSGNKLNSQRGAVNNSENGIFPTAEDNQPKKTSEDSSEDDLVQSLFEYIKSNGLRMSELLVLADPEEYEQFGLSSSPVVRHQRELSPQNRKKYPFRSIEHFDGVPVAGVEPQAETPGDESARNSVSEKVLQGTEKNSEQKFGETAAASIQKKILEGESSSTSNNNQAPEPENSYSDISFEEFKQLFRTIIEIHKNCHNCEHIKNFLKGLGFFHTNMILENRTKRGIRSQTFEAGHSSKLPNLYQK